MNRSEEHLAREIARRLNGGLAALDPATTEKLAQARAVALSRHRERPATVFGLAWATASATGRGGSWLHGARYVVVTGALLLGMAGFAWWQMNTSSDFADIE